MHSELRRTALAIFLFWLAWQVLKPAFLILAAGLVAGVAYLVFA